MVLTFTLQSAYSGTTFVAGPFDISGTTNGGTTTLLGDNISKANLLNGFTISDIDDATTGGTIQSVDGICSNSIPWTVLGPTDDPTDDPIGDPIGCLCYTIEVPYSFLTNNDDETLYLEYVNCDGNNTLLNTSNSTSLDTGTSLLFAVCTSLIPTLIRYGIEGTSQQAPVGITYTQGENCTSEVGCQPLT